MTELSSQTLRWLQRKLTDINLLKRDAQPLLNLSWKDFAAKEQLTKILAKAYYAATRFKHSDNM